MNKKVLIVEDNKDLSLLMCHLLLGAGIDAFQAANGWQALDVLDDIRPDLIVSDIGMPEMDGYELCKKLGEMENFRRIPVIILTGYTSRIDELRVLGIKEFLIKPVERARLLAAIQRALHNQEAG